jgi:hypothetical protein
MRGVIWKGGKGGPFEKQRTPFPYWVRKEGMGLCKGGPAHGGHGGRGDETVWQSRNRDVLGADSNDTVWRSRNRDILGAESGPVEPRLRRALGLTEAELKGFEAEEVDVPMACCTGAWSEWRVLFLLAEVHAFQRRGVFSFVRITDLCEKTGRVRGVGIQLTSGGSGTSQCLSEKSALQYGSGAGRN